MRKKSSARLKHNLKILEHLARCTPEECKHMIPVVKDDFIRLLAEVCVNVINKNIPLNVEEAVRLLSPFKKELKTVCRKKTSLKTKRKIFNQSGGFLPALLSLALPVLKNLLLQ